MRTRRAASTVLALLLTALPLAAQEAEREEILSYDVAVQVEEDGWMEVTEEIRVRALGEEIRRGIYRDFPTTFPRAGGFGKVRAPFEVVRVLRDGAPEPYVLQSVGGPAGRSGTRVRIGDPDDYLGRGEHSYLLTYRTVRWVRHGEEVDQLYWNVTGNGWAFPILRATARVTLPGPVDLSGLLLEGWTGPEGSTASDLSMGFDPGLGPHGAATFTTSAPLAPGEGLTVRLTFPQGIVAPPTDEQRAEWFRMDWGPWLDAGLVFLLALSVHLLLWNRVGRDPAGRPVPVRYEPPEGFSPAALGYVVERGYHDRQLTAAVVDLAVGGWIEIERDGRAWTLRRTADNSGGPPPAEEALLLRHLGLRGHGDSVTLRGSSHPKVRKAVKAFRSTLERRHEKRYFVLNRGWFLVGLAVTVAGFAALAWRVRYAIPPEGWFMGFWLTFWTMGTGTLVWRAAGQWKLAFSGDAPSWLSAIFLTLFSVPFVGAEIFVGYMLWQAVPAHLMATAVALGLVNVLFYHLLERPTLKGRGVLDRADGFRRFLGATEEDRIRRLQPAQASLELFERFLPWAIALEVESEWAERFEGALGASAVATAGGAGGALGWYHGAGSSSLSGMSTSLGGAFSSSLSASSSAPSSSGGGGGGGSSGGGGGGGGGGGW